MRSFLMTPALLVLMAAAVIAVGISLPLARHIYERPVFLWVSLVSAAGVGVLLVVTPFRARAPVKRKLLFFGLVATVTAAQVFRIYLDRGSPSLTTASPEVLAFFRELVHIVEYGVLAFMAAHLLEQKIGGLLLYLTALAYALIVGITDETLQWLHAFRVGDLRDVMTNAVSASVGLFYHAGLSPTTPRRVTSAGRWPALILLALSPLIFAEFYLRTQTGHQICDASGNCFQSNATEAELFAQAEARKVRWAGLPVGSLSEEEPRLWAREDYFLTEARAHFRVAVDAANVDDWNTACAELHILATYFAPSIPVIGIRLQDYPCRDEPENFHSRVFGHLVSDARPATWRALAALVGFTLLLWGWMLSRPLAR